MQEGIPNRASLLGRLFAIRDQRSRQGRRYPLWGLLGMLVLGALHGESSLRGMWMWGCKHWQIIRHPLGFMGNPHPPALSTVWYVISRVDMDSVEEAFREWVQSWSGEKIEAVSVDGKRLRGSRRLHPQERALEAVTAAGHELKVVLGEQAAPGGDQIAAALALLKAIQLEGKLVVADAGLLNRPVVNVILEEGGDYLGVVKDNQPELKEALDDWVEPNLFPPGRGTSSG